MSSRLYSPLLVLVCATLLSCDSRVKNPVADHHYRDMTPSSAIEQDMSTVVTPSDVQAPALPGITKSSLQLSGTLAEALGRKPTNYAPRTRHKDAQGAPLYTNRLIHATSPYLLQHAHNPVNWYGWSDEAFAHARALGRPVLLSIGYSTCHWCHVMEEESFEDPEVAAYINAHFIPIKVDREERPDLDDVYMKAVTLLTGRGGWPMTVVLTPDREPFFGGTYFPARDGDRGAHKGFMSILEELSTRYRDSPEDVIKEARALSTRMREQATPQPSSSLPDVKTLERTAHHFARTFDGERGGFGRAPKFPTPSNLMYLMRHWTHTQDPGVMHMVEFTLDAMAHGGIRDHVGGGFHRYSVDAQWLVPHFEKMLYDNAQLAQAYTTAAMLTGHVRHELIAREILDYVLREMTAPQGGFFSATDADSLRPDGHMEEGWFFTWTPGELDALLDPDEVTLFTRIYGITPRGNFEGRNIPHLSRSIEEHAAALSITPDALRARLTPIHGKLYEARKKRAAPLLDDKILTSWTALMVSAMARAGYAFDEPRYTAAAGRAATFVLEAMRNEQGGLQRSYRANATQPHAFLDDYAFMISALLDLFELTGEGAWIERAHALQARLDDAYWDETQGGYFMTSEDHEALLIREKPSYDGAEPSGNAVALENLVRWHTLTGDDAWRKRAERGLGAFSKNLTQRSPGMTRMLAALERHLDSPREIILVRDSTQPLSGGLHKVVRARYFWGNDAFIQSANIRPDSLDALLKPLKGKTTGGRAARVFVCEQGRCELPTDDPNVLAGQLKRDTTLFHADATRRVNVRLPDTQGQ